MMRLVRLGCLVGIVPQGSCHGAQATTACDTNVEPDFEFGDFDLGDFVFGDSEAEMDSSSLLQSSLGGVQDTSSTQIAASERPEAAAGGLLREHSMLQTSAALEAAGPPAMSFAELQVQLRNSDSDAIIAVVVVVGLPLVLCIACLFLVPRDGRSPRSEDNQRVSLKNAVGVPMGGPSSEVFLRGSRAPTQRLSDISLAQHVGNAEQSNRNFNLPRSDSLSSNASLPPSIQRSISESGTLCQSLIVPKAQGVTLGVEGDLLPGQQETVLEITMKDSTNNEGLLRLLISETGKDRGMLLESVLKLPIAILDTNAAAAQTGAESRQVLIRRDMDPTRAPFAVVRRGQGAQNVFRVTRGTLGGGEGEPLLSVLIDMGGLRGNIVSPEGKLVASMETRSEAGRTQRFLNICQGADAALVLCVVFAAIKLG